MKSTYNENLMIKYGIEEEDAEIITELKKRIRKISPLTKEQKLACEVCELPNSDEEIYNHHIMKVEYLAILAYYYDLYKKERNPNYVPHRGDSEEEKNTQSEKEFIYVLKKDKDLYIPRVGICERHHNMIHELGEDFEGSTNKGLLKKAKPKELQELYEIFAREDIEIYHHIFENDESLEGREYYISYLKIWNDTLKTAMTNLGMQVDYRLDPNRYSEELSKKNRTMLENLREQITFQVTEADKALDSLDPKFDLEGEIALDVNGQLEDNEITEEEKESRREILASELLDDDALGNFTLEELENMYSVLQEQNDDELEEDSDSEEQLA